MGKGWTRRPQAVDRKAFDEAYARTFSENGAVVEENGIVPPCGDTVLGHANVLIGRKIVRIPIIGNPANGIASVPDPEPTTPRKRPSIDACEIAEIMTSGPEEGFGDKWCEA